MSYWGTRAAGLLIRSQRGRYLLVLRSEYVYDPCVWGIPGGRVDKDEDPQTAAVREAYEELGPHPLSVAASPLTVWRAPDANFEYQTFLAASTTEFAPTLNWENEAYVWVTKNTVLSGAIQRLPVHPGVMQSIVRAP